MEKSGKEMSIDGERTYTAAEAAVIKGVTRRSVYHAIHSGRLDARRSNGIWLILGRDLAVWEVVGHRPRSKRDTEPET